MICKYCIESIQLLYCKTTYRLLSAYFFTNSDQNMCGVVNLDWMPHGEIYKIKTEDACGNVLEVMMEDLDITEEKTIEFVRWLVENRDFEVNCSPSKVNYFFFISAMGKKKKPDTISVE